MTPEVVLDASGALTLVLHQVGFDDVKRNLRGWRASAVGLLVPSHFWLETSNALLRRHRFTARAAMEALHQLDEFGLQTVVADRAITLLAIDRAEKFGLTTYAAAYLALAESVDATLYTSDRALLVAAGPRGLAIAGAADHRLAEAPAQYGIERRPTWPDYSGASAYLAKLRAEAARTA